MTPALHLERRARVVAAMAAADLDALVLGHQANATYATGSQRLWTAGTRPFGAGCVLTRDPDAVHVLSSWDEGVPDDIPFEHLYGITWNPRIMAAALRSIEGLVGAARVGVDALSPGFERAIGAIAPEAVLVPADDLMHDVRVTKLPAELERIEAACTVARLGLAAVESALRPGATSGALVGSALRVLADAGCTIPTSEPRVEVITDGRAGATTLQAGDLVSVDLGVLVDEYEGGVARTLTVGTPSPDQRALADRASARLADLAGACRPDVEGGSLAGRAGGDDFRLRGLGMGAEPPVVDRSLGSGAGLDRGMVLSVEVTVHEAGVGAHRRRDVVALTSGAPRPLSDPTATRP